MRGLHCAFWVVGVKLGPVLDASSSQIWHDVLWASYRGAVSLTHDIQLHAYILQRCFLKCVFDLVGVPHLYVALCLARRHLSFRRSALVACPWLPAPSPVLALLDLLVWGEYSLLRFLFLCGPRLPKLSVWKAAIATGIITVLRLDVSGR
jgi:hypothetical protein